MTKEIDKDLVDNIIIEKYKRVNKDWYSYDIRFVLDCKKERVCLETPFMNLPFGIEEEYSNSVLKLQFNGVKSKTNENMINFHNLIKNIEKKIVSIKEDNKIFKSSIIKKEKYDDLLYIKINKKSFNIDIKNNSGELKNIYDINKNSKLKCTIFIDKLWYNNTCSTFKFILDNIILEED
jgi:hypothetical protein